MDKATLIDMSNRGLTKHVYESIDRPIQHMVSHPNGIIYGEYGWFSDMSSHGVHLIEGEVEYSRDNVWEIGEHRFVKMLEDDDIWIKQMELDRYWERKRIDHDDLRATLARAFD